MLLVPLFLSAAILLELAGGLSLLMAFKTRIGALLLIPFLIPTTLIFHNSWALDGADRQMQIIHFMGNLAILGGLLVVSGRDPGSMSVDQNQCENATLRWRAKSRPLL
ncbi:MAG: DoxX family protein [Acidobacteriota bacterium]|jgi:putative oxidoreductase